MEALKALQHGHVLSSLILASDVPAPAPNNPNSTFACLNEQPSAPGSFRAPLQARASSANEAPMSAFTHDRPIPVIQSPSRSSDMHLIRATPRSRDLCPTRRKNVSTPNSHVQSVPGGTGPIQKACSPQRNLDCLGLVEHIARPSIEKHHGSARNINTSTRSMISKENPPHRQPQPLSSAPCHPDHRSTVGPVRGCHREGSESKR